MAVSYYYNTTLGQWVQLGAVSRSILPTNGGQEDFQDHGNTGATETVDLDNGNVHQITLDTNCTLTFTGTVNAVACAFTLIVEQDGSGGHTITWPGSVLWTNGTPPTLTGSASSIDIFTFFTVDDGTTWYGFTAGLDMS
jgi:hypothetical protein